MSESNNNESANQAQTAVFAAGCFWGVEARFRALPGVTDARVGYTGGHVAQPAYRQVCGGDTGHAEAVEVQFNPAEASYEQLLDAFWGMHDPTQKNRQGPDVGTQYRSAVFFRDEAQRVAAEESRALAQQRFSRPIVTEIVAATAFWPAEDYHQRYLEKRRGF